MGTLFVDRRDCHLSLAGKVLTLRAPDEPVRHIPLALLDRVVLRADTALTSSVLTGLAASDVGLIALGGRRGERVCSLLGAPHKDVRIRITQLGRLDDRAFCSAWSNAIVRAKLRSQQRHLQRALSQRPDLRKPLFDALATLSTVIERVHSGADVDSLRGFEGAGAAAYFRGFTRLFPASLGFSARNRRPALDPVNACLSLGYTLLHGLAVHACYARGLDPMVGYLHRPSHGRASMASDLMEPWRARVDALVRELFRTRLQADHFGTDGSGACMLGKAGRSHFYAAWAAQLKPLRRALDRHARLATRTLEDLAQATHENADLETSAEEQSL